MKAVCRLLVQREGTQMLSGKQPGPPRSCQSPCQVPDLWKQRSNRGSYPGGLWGSNEVMNMQQEGPLKSVRLFPPRRLRCPAQVSLQVPLWPKGPALAKGHVTEPLTTRQRKASRTDGSDGLALASSLVPPKRHCHSLTGTAQGLDRRRWRLPQGPVHGHLRIAREYVRGGEEREYRPRPVLNPRREQCGGR